MARQAPFLYAIDMFGKLFGKKSKDEAPPEKASKSPPPAPASKAAAPPPPPAAPATASPLPPIDPPRAMPADVRPTDRVAALAAQTQQGASALADAAAQVERAIRAGIGPKGAPLAPDAQNSLRAAAEALVAASDPASQAAAADIKAGRLMDAFARLKQDAEAAGPAKVERLRRLGALAFLVDAGTSLSAYQDAWEIDQRDFWHCIFLARLQGLGGRLDLSLQSATAAMTEARTPLERSQADAELTLIALGRSDKDGARKHAQIAVDTLRQADAPFDLAQRLSLQGDVAVILGDTEVAAQAYGESFDLVAKLGAQKPSDVNLARASADTMEKLAAIKGRQERHDEAQSLSGQAVDLRRRLHTAQPGEVVDIIALAAALNTFGELKRLANDPGGASACFKEAIEVARKAIAAAPAAVAAHREVWVGLWRLAQLPNSTTPWSAVVAALEEAKAKGGLVDRDANFLEEARRRASAGA